MGNVLHDMQEQTRVLLDFPFPRERVFRYQAMQDVLHHLVNNPLDEFTRKELAELTGADVSSISRSVDLLEALGVLAVTDEKPAAIRIDHDHLQKSDPILSVPQAEFRRPLSAFVNELRGSVECSDEVGEVVGVVLFGSVAWGTADRESDIDLLVIVGGSHTHARRIANRIAREVGGRTFGGDRYEFEVLVETPESAAQYGGKLREIFDEGIVLDRSRRLEDVRRSVYGEDPVG